MQWLQELQFHSFQDCGKEYPRRSATSENQLMGQSVRSNIGLCHHYKSVDFSTCVKTCSNSASKGGKYFSSLKLAKKPVTCWVDNSQDGFSICELVRSTPQSVEPVEQASSGSSSLSYPSSIGFSLLHVQKVQLGPVQLCIKPLRSSGTERPRSLTPGKGSKLRAVASTIATRESALNKNKKLQELARQTAECA